MSEETRQLRLELMGIIAQMIKDRGWNQKQAAIELKITQPRVSDLKNSKVEKFKVDSLLRYISRLGYPVSINFDVCYNA